MAKGNPSRKDYRKRVDMFNRYRSNDLTAFMPMRIVFQHLPNRTLSIYQMELPVKTSVKQLKRDFALRVKISPEYQKWTHRGKLLDDQDTILKLKLKYDDSIFIEQLSPSQLQQATSDDDSYVLAIGGR